MKRGLTASRPWGTVLAELATERLTGELVVTAEGKPYVIGFSQGLVARATSPLVADSLVRVAVTGHFVSSTQVAEIVKRIAAAPKRDELEVLAEIARLPPAQTETLRTKANIQRAARTFAIEQGSYVFDPGPVAGDLIDVRVVIYQGARLHLREARLSEDLRQLGSRFLLLNERDLARCEFTEAEQPILEALRHGTSVADLEATHRDLDPRMIAAVIYTLATTGACVPAVKASRTTTTPPVIARTMTPPPVVARTMTPPPVVARTMTPPPVISRTGTLPPAVASRAGTIPPLSRTMTPVAIARTATNDPNMSRTPTGDRTPAWLEGRDAYQRGEMAMRREQLPEAIAAFSQAVEVQPQNADYLAMLAWARFCACRDKREIAAESRKTLDRAIKLSEEAIIPWLCLGRVERMLGNDKEALAHFHHVLMLQPHNTAAASEARVIETRLQRR